MSVLHVHGGRLWPGHGSHTRPGSVTLRDDRIAGVEEHDGAGPPPQATRIDVRGGTIVPGLIDAHVHLLLGGRAQRDLDLSRVDGRSAFERAIAERHAELPPAEWLIGRGWSEERWPDHGLPESEWLSAAGDRPVVCYRADEHAAVVNDAVLQRCAVDRAPDGGAILRDARGRPTGMLIEQALWQLVNPLVPEPSVASRREMVLEAQRHLHRLGVTTVGTMEYARDVVEVFAPMAETLTLNCRVTLLDREWPLAIELAGCTPPSSTLAIIGFKTFIDGTLGSRTARMLEPYADDAEQRGMFVELAADGHLAEWVRLVRGAGLSPSMHAIGDAAVRCALQACEDACAHDARAGVPRIRIEHAQQIDGGDLPRFAGTAIASMQPVHMVDDAEILVSRLGRDRIAGFFPFRALLDAGAMLAFGSDWPIATCDPVAGIRAAVEGVQVRDGARAFDQTIAVAEALHAYTGGAAAALSMEDAGVIEPRARGDLTVFDRDPFTADWAHRPPRVLMTIAGGVVVYDGRGGSEPSGP